ncbi:MAG: hypothetical protein AAFZ67_14665, partial [Planctomycetota bacterium]
NFTSRASSHGLQVRNGGDVLRNVFWENPIALSYGNEGRRGDEFPVSGDINDNVVLEAIDMNSDRGRGWGIQLQNANGVSVSRNIFANARVEGGYGLMLFTSNPADNRDLVVEDNVIDDFGRNLRIDEDDVISTTIRNNLVTSSGGSRPLMVHRGSGDFGGLVYEGNRYLHASLDLEFELDRDAVDLAEWQARIDPMGGLLLPGGGANDPYVNGSATLADYARSIGMGDAESFINAMREQRKGNWDERLTTEPIRGFFKEAFTLRSGG